MIFLDKKIDIGFGTKVSNIGLRLASELGSYLLQACIRRFFLYREYKSINYMIDYHTNNLNFGQPVPRIIQDKN
jgi:hypothetical protein